MWIQDYCLKWVKGITISQGRRRYSSYLSSVFSERLQESVKFVNIQVVKLRSIFFFWSYLQTGTIPTLSFVSKIVTLAIYTQNFIGKENLFDLHKDKIINKACVPVVLVYWNIKNSNKKYMKSVVSFFFNLSIIPFQNTCHFCQKILHKLRIYYIIILCFKMAKLEMTYLL